VKRRLAALFLESALRGATEVTFALEKTSTVAVIAAAPEPSH
jgi:hypothetical protein